MKFEVTGKIVRVFDLQSGKSQNGKEWKKQDYLLETLDEDKNQIAFGVFGVDKVNSVSANLGDIVKVIFRVVSREWKGKFYTNIEADFIDSVQGSSNVTVPSQPVMPEPDDTSDLPF